MDARKAWLQRLQAGCLLVIAAVVGYGYARQPPPAPPTNGPAVAVDSGFPVVAQARPADAPAPPPTIDALLAEIVKLRKQKQELEVREQALVKQVRDRLRDLGDKLTELGISAAEQGGVPPPATPAPAVQVTIPVPGAPAPAAPGIAPPPVP